MIFDNDGNTGSRPHGSAYYGVIYTAALALIALVALANFFIIDRIVGLESTSSTVLKVTARQATLSQRISGLSYQYGIADGAERARLKPMLRQAIGLMRSSHEALIQGDEQLGIPARMPEALDEIYFSETDSLDQEVRRFLSMAEDYLGLPDPLIEADNQGLLRLMGAAQDDLFDRLTVAVTRYAETSRTNLEELRGIMYLLIALLLAILVLEALFIFRPLFRNLVRQRETLFEIARTDDLTGCLNRRSILLAVEAEFARFKRYGKPLTLAMIDIDHFKRVNDTYGHAGGDEVLKALVAVSRETIRATDVFGRMGGEEFAVVLPETDLAGAAIFAEKLRANLEAAAVDSEGATIRFTVSIGLGGAQAGDRSETQALSRADKALYQAKDAGRNQVAVFDLERMQATV